MNIWVALTIVPFSFIAIWAVSLLVVSYVEPRNFKTALIQRIISLVLFIAILIYVKWDSLF